MRLGFFKGVKYKIVCHTFLAIDSLDWVTVKSDVVDSHSLRGFIGDQYQSIKLALL